MGSTCPSWDLCPLSSKFSMACSTAPRINPKLLTMALHDPSSWPRSMCSHLCLLLLPLLPLSPLHSLQTHPPSRPLYWPLLPPGTLLPTPSHGCLLLEFGAPSEMSLFREVFPTTQPRSACQHLHGPHYPLNIYLFTCFMSVCVFPSSPPVTTSIKPAETFCLVPYYDLSPWTLKNM